MTARTLLYAADGSTPIAFEKDGDIDAERLLIVAFGALKGLTPKGPVRDPRALQNYQEQVVTAIVDLVGLERIERMYRIKLQESEDPAHVMKQAGGVQ